jgi:Ca-activated chloride channel family protein
MEGEKIEQARDALTYVLEHLNSEDRFNVVSFSTGVRPFASGLRPASEREEAIAWVNQLDAVGGTDINRALLEALAQVDPERPTVLIFLTDGLPTEGVTEIEQILSNVDSVTPDNVRLFPFGVGYDVNTVLLDTLAQEHRGTTGYVRPDERIDEEISAFYASVSTPVLTDIELDFGDVVVADTYPDPLPDLFAGTQLILTGRYRGEGPVRIDLTGLVDGEVQEFVYEGVFSEEGGDEFIPRLWATRKIGHLLTEIRLHGEREEWVDAVIDLSVRYGIITPYTSFLIQEDLWTEAGREDAAQELMATPSAASGAPAVEMADAEAGLREAEAAGPGMLPEEAARTVRQVGSKAFVLRDGVWTDTTFDPETMVPLQVGFGSDGYFDLLESRPEWGEYFAVGQQVIFVAEGQAYELVLGEGDPVEIPPTRIPEPTAEPPTAVAPTEVPVDVVPQNSLCPGLGLMVGGLTAAVVWLWRGAVVRGR